MHQLGRCLAPHQALTRPVQPQQGRQALWAAAAVLLHARALLTKRAGVAASPLAPSRGPPE